MIQSQRGALDKFIIREQQPISTEEAVAEQNNEESTEVRVEDESNGDHNMVHEGSSENVDVDEEFDGGIPNHDLNESVDEPTDEIPNNIYDPKIWDCLAGQWRDLLVEKGPIRDLSLKKGPKDKANRCFSSKFYTRQLPNGEKHDRIWLVYSKDVDKVFCFCCKLFKKKLSKNQLANDGYGDWRHLSERLKEHELSIDHISNMVTWIGLQLRFQNKHTIDQAIQDSIQKEKDHWRFLLQRLISIVKYLSKYNLAFRGSNHKIGQECNGNFVGLVEMLAEHDPLMKEHLRRIQDNEIRHHYLSNRIQNELIQLLSSKVRDAILKKVREAKYYSVILDCTPDVNHQKQMTLVLRSVDMSGSPVKIEEYFVQFFIVNDTSGSGLFEELQTTLKTLDLKIDDVRGQGYDNGSNMKGCKQGVQRRLLDINPRAFYTACGCHSLNLTLCDIANCHGKAKDLFGVVQRIYSLFANSTKLWQILKDNLKGVTLKSLSTTRWESRVDSIKAIITQPLQIREALLQLAESDTEPKISSEARSIARFEFDNFEFLLSLTIWYNLLVAVNKVSKRLQTKDIHIDVAIELIKGLIDYPKKYRETGFEEAMTDAKRMAIEMQVDPVFPERREIRRKRHFDETGDGSSQLVPPSGEENFRVHYFILLVDQAIGSLERRFEQYQVYEKNFGFLLRPEKLSEYGVEELKSCCHNLSNNLKKEEHFDVEPDDLFVELKLLQTILPGEITKATDVLDFLKKMNCFPASSIAYRILLTIPVTVASAERSFSKLKLLKSYLRSSMSQDRLNGLALLSIESGFLDKIDYEDLIDDFASKNARRTNFN